MSSQTIESNNKQIKNIREETNRIGEQQQQQQQIQQIAENTTTTTSTISNTITQIINSNRINENQNIDKAILDKNIDTANRYQQETINTIQSIFNNYNQLQKNIISTYQSAFSKFIINDASYNSQSHLAVLEQLKVYSKINQNIIDSTINSTRTIHELLVEYTKIFNKSIELGQKYYSDGIKNYFNFKKIVRI